MIMMLIGRTFISSPASPTLRFYHSSTMRSFPCAEVNLSATQLDFARPKLLSPHRTLTDEEKQEMIQLRTSDPKTWTQKKLKDKFQVSGTVISSIAPCPELQKFLFELEKIVGSTRWYGPRFYRAGKTCKDRARKMIQDIHGGISVDPKEFYSLKREWDSRPRR